MPWVIGIAVIVLLAVLLIVRASHQKQKEAQAAKAKAAQRAVPVAGAVARTGDLPVYLTGLGTVTALNTVTVRSRVDGQLIRVAFQEGQLVHAEDLLAEFRQPGANIIATVDRVRALLPQLQASIPPTTAAARPRWGVDREGFPEGRVLTRAAHIRTPVENPPLHF